MEFSSNTHHFNVNLLWLKSGPYRYGCVIALAVDADMTTGLSISFVSVVAPLKYKGNQYPVRRDKTYEWWERLAFPLPHVLVSAKIYTL